MGSVRMIKLKQALNIQYYIIYTMLAFRQKKIVLFPDIFLSFTRWYSQMCIRIYFPFQKTNKQAKKKQEYKKSKRTKEENRISPKNRLKKINLWPPRGRFFSSPAFPETIVSLLALVEIYFDLN